MHTIIFDFGNVISSYDRDIFFEKLLEKSELEKEEAIRLFDNHFGKGGILEGKFSRGEIKEDEFITKIRETFKAKLTDEEFREIYCSMFDTNDRIVGLIRNLSKRYRIQLFSDTNPIHYKRVVRKSQAYPYIDAETLSFEVGVEKKEEGGFLDSINKTEADRQEIVFIDDKIEHVDKARKLGIKGIQFTGYTELLKDLKDIGVKIV